MTIEFPKKTSCTITRRGFLAAATTAAVVPQTFASAADDDVPALRVPPGQPPSRVVRVAARDVVDGATVHRPFLREMLRKVVTSVAQTKVESDAWHSLLDSDDVIALKFNRSAQEKLATSEAMADTLIQSLVEAGFSPAQIVCIEAPAGVVERNGTTSAQVGFARSQTSFASGSDQLALVLDQVDAIINVPFLKTHNIAGMTCALKNLSHALVKHPARFHAHRCSPYIGDIVSIPAIRRKLRLHIVDGLRVVYDGGPEARTGAIRNLGMVLASTDPVAVDAVGLEVLNEVREVAGLSRVARGPAYLPYLRSSHERGLGVAARHAIEVALLGP